MPPSFRYVDPFPHGKDETPYRKVSSDFVSVATFEGQEVLKVAPEALALVAREAFRDVSFLYRPSHLAQVAAILDDPEASANDRGVALALLRNAEVAAGFVLPMCQDTGTATIVAKKGQQVWTGGGDAEHLSRGVFDTYTKENLRYSQTVPLTMYDEANSGSNLPAQVDVYATDGMEYRFLMHREGRGLREQDVPLPGDEGASQPVEPRCSTSPRRCGRSARPRARRITSRSSSAGPRPRRASRR